MSLAGTVRTLVAVGTESEASMLCTTRPATPRSGSTDAAYGAGSAGVVIGRGARSVGGCSVGGIGGALGAEIPVEGFSPACDLGIGGTPFGGAAETCGDAGATAAATGAETAVLEGLPTFAKNSAHDASTEEGF